MRSQDRRIRGGVGVLSGESLTGPGGRLAALRRRPFHVSPCLAVTRLAVTRHAKTHGARIRARAAVCDSAGRVGFGSHVSSFRAVWAAWGVDPANLRQLGRDAVGVSDLPSTGGRPPRRPAPRLPRHHP